MFMFTNIAAPAPNFNHLLPGNPLQSYVAALVAVVPVSLMLLRLLLEEHFLRRDLPGYAVYAARVRYRLIPGVW
jgi:protein-S-isoprenylcysteine O-methyltransferase Ste14